MLCNIQRHLIWAGRKWQNGNAVYHEFCLAIRDLPGRNSFGATSLRYLTCRLTQGRMLSQESLLYCKAEMASLHVVILAM